VTAANPPRTRRALLLIDFQRDFLDGDGRMPVARNQVGPVLAATRVAVEQARADGDLIVKIGNEFRRSDWIGNVLRRHAAVAGSTGTAWDARADARGAAYLPKWRGSAYCNPVLQELLTREGVGHVTLCGLYARACVTATARAAMASGLRVTVLRDAVACRSDASREAALRQLARRGIEIADAIPGQSS
jgi:nicotinamidase-related amidase